MPIRRVGKRQQQLQVPGLDGNVPWEGWKSPGTCLVTHSILREQIPSKGRGLAGESDGRPLEPVHKQEKQEQKGNPGPALTLLLSLPSSFYQHLWAGGPCLSCWKFVLTGMTRVAQALPQHGLWDCSTSEQEPKSNAHLSSCCWERALSQRTGPKT